MRRTYVVISDTQIPYQDQRALAGVIRFIGSYQPDEVVQIGDLADFPQPSQWSKDSRGEYEGSIFRDAETVKEKFLKPLRAVYSGQVGVIEGNHDLRPRQYLKRYAPALEGSPAFELENLFDFKAFDVAKLPDFYEFSPGWLMCHGHLARFNISPIAGNTALNGAKKIGKSVVMGHTHRLGKGSHSVGYDGKITSTLTGVEVGHLMDMKAAGYLKRGVGDWQMGFGVIHVDGHHVQAEVIAIRHRKFIVDGQTYSC
ncbi:metallophosphoesterase [Kutzneria chonburiensis]|uniref:Metallophosphoesterase n=1 Tax=Kutzneria chonburiensis TaxID=1483604 RepID=A0ABV6N3A1_9PSEU|nr:metallophosphoesterase [Kutzneria chonburiensis]